MSEHRWDRILGIHIAALRWAGFLGLTVCLLAFSGAVSNAYTQQQQGEDTDFGAADEDVATGEDEDVIEDEEEAAVEGDEAPEGPSEGEEAGRIAAESYGIHPAYTVTYDRNRDMATWNHQFQFNYGFTPRIRLNSSSTMRQKSSLTAERVSKSQNTSNGIDFRVAEGLSMGFNITRNWSEDETGAGGGKERVQEGLEINANYSTLFLGVLDTKVQAGAGTEDREYADVVSKGNTERISTSFKFDPIENLKTSFSYSGGLRISDSEQGGFASRDRNVDEKLNVTADYKFWEEQQIRFTVSGQQTEAQYPHKGEQETRSMDDRDVSIKSDLVLNGFKVGVKFNASDAKTIYALDVPRDNRKTSQGLQITVPRRNLLWGFSGNLSIADERRRSEFKSPQTGTTTKHAVLGGLSRDLGPNSTMGFKGRMELTQYMFDDRVANPRDKDLMNQVLQLDLKYNPNLVNAALSAEYKRSEQINIMPASAADNNTRHTYSIRPNFSLSLWRNVSVSQTYTLSADYTLYHSDEARNLLVRTATMGTQVRFPLVGGLRLNMGYDYNVQDQGGYREDEAGVSRYAKASETSRQRLTLRTGFKVSKITLDVSESYEINKRWDFPGGQKNLRYDASSTDIAGNISTKFELGPKTKVDITMRQTQRAGNRLSESEKKFWNVNARVVHTF